MSKTIKKLVAEEYGIEEEITMTYPVGYKFTHIVDPTTGKTYEPNPEWEVTSDDLGALFREVDNNSIIVNKS